MSDEGTLLALAAIGRCLWERTRRVVRLCLCGFAAHGASATQIGPSTSDPVASMQHAGLWANQSGRTTNKMKQLEKWSTARSNWDGENSRRIYSWCTAHRWCNALKLQIFATLLLLLFTVNTTSLATLITPMFDHPRRWALLRRSTPIDYESSSH